MIRFNLTLKKGDNLQKKQLLKNINQTGDIMAENANRDSSMPKLTITLQDKHYTLPINSNSTIQKLALQLMLMIYDELLEHQLKQQAKQIHTKICQLIIQSVYEIIKSESSFKNKSFLVKMVQQYETKYQNLKKTNHKQKILKNNQNQKYFLNHNNFQSSSQDYDQQDSQDFQDNSHSKNTYNLYQKAQKSIEKKRKLEKENAQQKFKKQISYCTFHPNISKSQKKIKSKENSNVFSRLYTDADELKIKNFFKKRQVEEQEEKINSSFKFVPEINPCSKQIMKLKEKQKDQNTSAFQDLNKSQVSFQASQNSSYKYLKDQSSKKVFQKLYDSRFYENRLNKTIQKIQHDKQNQCPFHPQLSAGTKRLTKDLPNLQSRLKLYALRKNQQNNKSGNLSKPKKQFIKNASKSFIHPQKEQFTESNKKGIRRMLQLAKNIRDENQNKYKNVTNRVNSEIFYINNTHFFDDENEEEITPKKQNTTPLSENFFIQNQPINNGKTIKSANFKTNNNKIKHHQVQNVFEQNQLQNKDKIFERIFSYLTQGRSQLTIEMIRENRNIPIEIIKILMPLLEQMAEIQTDLDEEEFVWSLENLYGQLSIQLKAILLSWGLKLLKEKSRITKNKNDSYLKHIKTQGSVFQLVE